MCFQYQLLSCDTVDAFESLQGMAHMVENAKE